jgi:surfeit locus 1 family protein
MPTLAAVLFAVLTITLGQWQWGKAERKAILQASHDEGGRLAVLNWKEVEAMGEAALYRRVRLRGHFAFDYQVLLDNRVQAGRAGYHVVTPLRLDQGGAVLVNRGWLEAEADRRRLPQVAAPNGPQEVEGILVQAQGRYLELARGGDTGPVWQNLDMERYRAWFGGDSGAGLLDWLVLQTSPAGDGLVRDWPQPDLGIARHRSYAVQWFSLCALILGLWGYFVLVKRGGP